jgi:hypothetical protein
MGVLNGDSPEPRGRPSRQTQNGHAGTNLRRRQRATPEASPISPSSKPSVELDAGVLERLMTGVAARTAEV